MKLFLCTNFSTQFLASHEIMTKNYVEFSCHNLPNRLYWTLLGGSVAH